MKSIVNLSKTGEGVFLAEDGVVRLGEPEIMLLKEEAKRSLKKRARICAHRRSDDALHEMIIVMLRETYIQPHAHRSKSESFHIIEGLADIVLFNDLGAITEVIRMGPIGSGLKFFYRLGDDTFHTVLVRTEMLVFHETTNGPFQREKTVFAPFAPNENDEDGPRYTQDLVERVSRHLGAQ